MRRSSVPGELLQMRNTLSLKAFCDVFVLVPTRGRFVVLLRRQEAAIVVRETVNTKR